MKEKEKKLVLKIAVSTWNNASRDKRELSVVKELGADVIVMAKGEKTGEWEDIDGFRVFRVTTRPLGEKCPKFINRGISFFTWAKQARKIRPDVISGHDLSGLYIGWISSWFVRKKNRPKLIYDSHEFTIYTGKESKVRQTITKILERIVIKKCAFVLEVNDQIAEEVQKIHKLKEKPVVVRNVPGKWIINQEVCAEVRKKIEAEFSGSNTEKYMLLMYHGAIVPSRGVKTLVELVEKNQNIAAVILGNGDEIYIQQLKELSKKISGNRIYFHEAVPQGELWKYIGAVDLGMILAPASSKSYLYSLPNKFFENIQAETPVICPNYPSMMDIMNKYKFGLCCDPTNIEEILKCVEKLYTDKDFYQTCKAQTKIAKEVLNWDKEKVILKEAYGKVI